MSDDLDRLRRIAVALGGILIFIGLIIMGVFVLALFRAIELGIFEKYRVLFSSVLLLIGLLDLAGGIILARR